MLCPHVNGWCSRSCLTVVCFEHQPHGLGIGPFLTGVCCFCPRNRSVYSHVMLHKGLLHAISLPSLTRQGPRFLPTPAAPVHQECGRLMRPPPLSCCQALPRSLGSEYPLWRKWAWPGLPYLHSPELLPSSSLFSSGYPFGCRRGKRGIGGSSLPAQPAEGVQLTIQKQGSTFHPPLVAGVHAQNFCSWWRLVPEPAGLNGNPAQLCDCVA